MKIDTTETSLATQWFHLERITGTASAVGKEKQMVPDLNVDWEKLEHFARIGLLSIGGDYPSRLHTLRQGHPPNCVA